MTSNPLFVEPLEPRIAPAILVNGGNLLGAKFGPTTGETSSGGNTVTLVKVLSGSALVFYDGLTGHISSISVGDKTTLDITGNVGDIVTNLDSNGRLTDSDGNPANGEDGGILLGSSIKGITTHPLTGTQYGSVGRIIAGGGIKNIETTDSNAQISGIYAGDGIFHNTSVAQVSTGSVDFNTIASGLQNTFVLNQAQGQFKSGASITNATISIGDGLEVFAGSGSSSATVNGGSGGSITGVHVVTSFGGNGHAAAINLHAGDGGNGRVGGAGGSILTFTDDGSTTLVRIQTGHGGGGFDGDGGAGGSLFSSTIKTASSAYRFEIGAGGDGSQHGGIGGSIKGLSFTSNIVTGNGTLIASGDFNGDGVPDVVVVNGTTGNAVVSLASDSPAFTPVTQADGTMFVTPQGLAPSDIVTGDFNGDGRLDYAVSYTNSNNIGVFYNNGQGQFTGTQVSLLSSPFRLVTGDFAGSAAPDFAYVSQPDLNSSTGSQFSHVYVVVNNGDSTFTPELSSNAIAGKVTDIVAAPIDADAHTDVLVSVDDTAGTIQPLIASGSDSGLPFNSLAPILTNAAHITNLDATVVNGALHVLAFSADPTAGSTDANGTATAPVPVIKLLTVDASGGATIVAGTVASGATLAKFVGDVGDYGELSGAGIQINSLDGKTSITYSATSGAPVNFVPLGVGDSVAAVPSIPTSFFYSNDTTLPAITLPIIPQEISLIAGDGGHGGTEGGKGGEIKTLTFTQTLDGGADSAGGTYTTNLDGGNGGVSDVGTGGTGGKLNKISVNVDPGNSTLNDDTTLLSMHAGAGGAGFNGGRGGLVTGLTATALYDQTSASGVFINSFAVEILAGAGGVGSQGFGGAGGTVTLDGRASLTGVSFYDAESPSIALPGLIVAGGDGGAGATFGGAGGSAINVGSQNALLSGGAVLARNELATALISGGNGGVGLNGNGGAGGDVTGADVAVQEAIVFSLPAPPNTPPSIYGGSLTVLAGNGGQSTGGVGGSGGSINSSTLASSQGDHFANYGVLAAGGQGGDGTNGGGAGGGISKLTLNSPSDPSLFAAALFGGDGGASLGGGLGGAGGGIKGVTQTKDVNSSINAIMAGNGGAGGGVGGSISKVTSVGFIGSPNSAEQNRLGAFNDSITAPAIASFFASDLIPQGIFAGRGDGGNGSVTKITARQISAIGAGPDANNLFAPAASISRINADLIGYDAAGGTDGVFDSTAGSRVSPSTAVPIDGFILASAVSEINTVDNARTGEYTFLG